MADQELYLMINADDGHQKAKIEVRVRIVGIDTWNGKQAKPYQGSQVSTVKQQHKDTADGNVDDENDEKEVKVKPHPLERQENNKTRSTGLSTINSTVDGGKLTTPKSSLSSSFTSSLGNNNISSNVTMFINNGSYDRTNNINNNHRDINDNDRNNGNSIEMNIDQPTVAHSQIHHLLHGSSGYPGLPGKSSNLLRSFQGVSPLTSGSPDESIFNPRLSSSSLIWSALGLMSFGLVLGFGCILMYQKSRPLSHINHHHSSIIKVPIDYQQHHHNGKLTRGPKVCVNKSESSGTGISSISFSTRSSTEYEDSAFIGWPDDYEKPLSSPGQQQHQQHENHISLNNNNNHHHGNQNEGQSDQLTINIRQGEDENPLRAVETIEGGKGSIDDEILYNNRNFDEWEYPRSMLRIIGILGEGCFGRVWKCEAYDIKNREGASIVAVKALKEGISMKERLDMDNELTILKKLKTHPNVISLLGCCTEKEPKFLILEYVPFGTLQTYLRNHRGDCFNRSPSSIDYYTDDNVSAKELLLFAYQIAKGMEHIVSEGIIHRDLAARNILIGTNKTCKITDFGFSREISFESIYESKSEGRLPIRWMAPEALKEYIFSVKSDVWSFGVLMWEIVTLGSTPYPGMDTKEVMRKVINGYRLDKPDHCRREMYNIMYYCWENQPTSRPTFTELINKLDKLIASETDYIQLDRFPDHLYYNIIETPLSGEKL